MVKWTGGGVIKVGVGYVVSGEVVVVGGGLMERVYSDQHQFFGASLRHVSRLKP